MEELILIYVGSIPAAITYVRLIERHVVACVSSILTETPFKFNRIARTILHIIVSRLFQQSSEHSCKSIHGVVNQTCTYTGYGWSALSGVLML